MRVRAKVEGAAARCLCQRTDAHVCAPVPCPTQVIDSEIRRTWLPQPGLHDVKQGEDGAESAGIPTAAVAGGAAGAVVLAAVAVYAALVVYARRKRQARSKAHLVDGDDSKRASAGGAERGAGGGRGDASDGSFSSIASSSSRGSTGPPESIASKHGEYENPLYRPPRSPEPTQQQQQPSTPTTPAAAPAQLPDFDDE